ncbi:hypothetical protein PHYBLDRAFT_188593 [Phycomyces blakesleeanus NRRL 1555(-)]|uniref:Transmembrane protein 135 N-terminal domain-containing protein n=1 Tax=Phycomyces blakesleeanus (strain ATCC 8743b / DSM 1359 / FGSC 10004 / NBRC 33097 / NRRL 1555) TaxID=763407 RepID=A0A163D6H3_PHYB8|nr:hypothetical protein PHYBLDRAFT_188593 [Phycomyces blakesleeanus NRRL 1555(-)]OAD69100.1 hypothetical protein PHYBLDRAFT_188593 [Phycomyces blakesleeanus NRRL 1555(-)]|eukprot:XP_018287140.1 hypothetical protein PHYBLDRAFT_188593 [Phycomyces blakesleeanus NRRL 1555(-)]
MSPPLPLPPPLRRSPLQVLTSKSGLPVELQPALATAIKAYGLGWSFTTVPSLVAWLVKLVLCTIKRDLKGVSKLARALGPMLQKSITKNGMPVMMTGVLSGHSFLSYVLSRIPQPWWGRKRDPSVLPIKTLTGERVMMIISAATTMFFCRRAFKMHTLDLTLTVLTRAFDTIGFAFYASPWASHLPGWILDYGSVMAFTAVTAEVLYTWIYEPSRLPRSYAKWISNIGSFDERLFLVLRGFQDGSLMYGKDTGKNNVLDGLADDLGCPRDLCNPLNGRIPCFVVHNGQQYGCEVNALTKISTAFSKAYPLYFMVHVVLPLCISRKRLREDPVGTLSHSIRGSIRSTSFISALVGILMYSMCLTRTRIGHQLLRAPQKYLDHSWALVMSCTLSGLSVMLESKPRRAEMALYVAPRAMRSLTDRCLSMITKNRWWEAGVGESIETMVFSVSVAIILEAMYKYDSLVRSSTKSMMTWVLKEELEKDKK